MSTPSVTQPRETDQQIAEIVRLAQGMSPADYCDLVAFIVTKAFLAGLVSYQEFSLRIQWIGILRNIELGGTPA